MSANTFGKIFRLTSFGESHGKAIGGIIDGCPAGLKIDLDYLQSKLDKRRPGQNSLVSPRKEADKVEILSGVYDSYTIGTPIAFYVKNEDVKSEDYDHLKEAYRPGHADFVYQKKYGIRDHRGGGRSSARETISRVVAGTIAQLILDQYKIKINAFVSQVKSIKIPVDFGQLDFNLTDSNLIRCPHTDTAKKMIELIEEVRSKGDSVGGVISCVINGVPAGWGEPVFDKLHADLGKAMLSINAVKGFQIGSGFNSINFLGSEMNDLLVTNEEGSIITKTNHAGGIQGGISNGMPILFDVGFKPVSSIMKDQESVNQTGEKVMLEGKGRHDPCVLPRAVPIVESMAALVLVDHLLRNRNNKI